MLRNGIHTEQLAAFDELLHTTPEAGALSVEVRTDWTDGHTVRAGTAGTVVGGGSARPAGLAATHDAPARSCGLEI
jgi:hypothetical protein